MAGLGFRTVEEMVGRCERLEMRPALEHWKARGVDLSQVLHQPEVAGDAPRQAVRAQDHGLAKALDGVDLAGLGGTRSP